MQVIAAQYQAQANPEIADIRTFFSAAILAAHRQILRYAAIKKLNDSPRTTIVIALVQNGAAHWAHSGDSRLYFVRRGELMARTRDHSYLEQRKRVRAAELPPEIHNRNVLYTCLGSPTRPEFDMTGPVPLQQGDKILLCSDGLWGSLDEADLVFHLGQKPVSTAAPDLVERALLKAGAQSDNVTLIAMEWETPDAFASTRGSISTENIDEGVFASTVQAAWLDSTVEELDDEGISRNIAEINEAIRRGSVRKP
jgi:serine/threonine protein phosphatase PrpC